MFLSLEAIRRKAELVPGFKERYRYIAEGRLYPEDGVIEHGSRKSGHATWWPYEGVAREFRFSTREKLDVGA